MLDTETLRKRYHIVSFFKTQIPYHFQIIILRVPNGGSIQMLIVLSEDDLCLPFKGSTNP